MTTAGIVAEYNPFHTGHAYQIAETKRALGEDCAVVAVMSGNWVQQADCAVADKWTRARLALMGGVDLVLEVPTVWATASAEGFARGAVALLEAAGVVDVLSFGSECGDVKALERVAECLDSGEYRARLAPLLQQGLSFPAARQRAAAQCIGQAVLPLVHPNNNLGIEYIRALNALGSSIRPMTVLRQGAGHNAVFARVGEGTDGSPSARDAMPRFVSATQIRRDLLEGDWDRAEPYLLPGARQVLEGGVLNPDGLSRVERAILARVRTITAEKWAALPDSGAAEGLPWRLERAGHRCASLEEFFQSARSKRYTASRLHRLVLRAYLGITREDIPARPPYLRVLGLNGRGRALLREMKGRSGVPMVTKPAHAKALDGPGQALFRIEARCTDLYDLCLEQIPAPGREWRENPVVLA